MILLLAKDRTAATEFALKQGMQRSSWCYIMSAATLLGLAHPYVCRVGDYYLHPDIERVEKELDMRQSIYLSALDIKQSSV